MVSIHIFSHNYLMGVSRYMCTLYFYVNYTCMCFVFIFRIDPDLRSRAYCYGIKTGGYAEWEFAFNRYKRETVASEKIKLLYGLSCSETTWILNK